MNVTQLHTEVRVALQNLNVRAIDDIEEEEIDFLLNTALRKYIKDKMSEHTNARSIPFQGTPKRVEEFESLITPIDVDVFKDDDNTSFIYLSGNHFQHIRFNVGLYKNCFQPVNLLTVNKKLYYINLETLIDYVETGFYIYVNNELVYNSNLYQEFYTFLKEGGDLKAASFYFIKHIMDVLNNIHPKIVDVYYEQFGEYTKTNSLLFYPKFENTAIKFLKFGETNSTTLNHVELNHTKIIGADYNNILIYKPLEVIKEYEVDDILNYSFSKPKPDNNKGSIKRNRLYIYHPGYKIVSVKGEYIKEPVDINIHLNQLPNIKCLSEVALLAAKIYAGRVNSPNYQTLENEKALNNND